MTPDEVRIKLGLLPFEEFAAKNYNERVAKALSKGGSSFDLIRKTGRSTKIYCDVIACLSSGNKTVFASKTMILAVRSVGEIKKLAKELNIPTANSSEDLVFAAVNSTDGLRGVDPTIIFRDHPMP